MNMFKKNGGFTLVELIVVIAILAILAAVAVPAYTGYIEKAQDSANLQQLSAVNTAAQGLAIAEGAKVTGITVSEKTGGWEITVTTDKDGTDAPVVTDADITALTGALTFNDQFKGATWAEDATTGRTEWELK